MTTAHQAFQDPSAVSPDHAVAPVTDMTERIAARKVIDRAKGLLMANLTMTEPEAYRWIQKSAMDRRTPMAVIADRIVDGFGNSASRAS